MNLENGHLVEIRYPNEHRNPETRCGWFQRLYPTEPQFVEIAHRLERNHCPRDVVQYKLEQIYWLIRLESTF